MLKAESNQIGNKAQRDMIQLLNSNYVDYHESSTLKSDFPKAEIQSFQ